MRTTVKIMLLALTVSFISCSKSNDDNVSPNNASNKVEQVSGSWTVSYFMDSGKDETSDYSGYRFSFGTDGVLSVSGTASFNGTWWIGNSGSDDDNSSNRLNILITGNKVMDHLQDDWVILKLNASEIWLRDDNSSSMEEIHFVRTNQS